MIDGLVDGSSALWPAVATHLWQSTLVLLALGLLSRALRGAPARLICLFWWVALLKLFLPLPWVGRLGETVFAAVRSLLFSTPIATADWTVPVWIYPEVLQVAAPDGASAWPALYAAMSVGWLAGVALLLLRLLPSRRNNAGSSTPHPLAGEAGVEERLAAALEGTSIPRGSVRVSRCSELPHVQGWWNPRIHVSPVAVQGLDVDDLRAVLLHENAHRRRRDPLRFLALRLAGAFLFFYPPVWWLIRRIGETTEIACDEAALAAGVSADDYAGALARTLRLGLGQAGPATAIHGRRSSLEQRFSRLAGNRRFVTMKRHRIALAAAVLLVVAASFAPIIPAGEGETDVAFGGVPPIKIEGLDGLEKSVDLNFKDTRLATVLDTLGRRAGFTVRVGPRIRNERITLRLDDVTVGTALQLLAQENRLAYSVPQPGTLLAERSGPLLAGVGDVTNPTLISESKVDPLYPEGMRAERIQGSVILQAVIDENGNVSELEVLRAEPLDRADMIASASAAVSQWRYQPATRHGRPVPVYFTIFVEYKLHEQGEASDEEPGLLAPQ